MDKREWLEARLEGIGGSEAAVVLGQSPWKSAAELWVEKVKRQVSERDAMRLRFGSYAERFICSEYERETGVVVDTSREGMKWHPEVRGMFANVDGIIIASDGKRYRDDGIFEAKTVGTYAFRKYWDDEVPPIQYQIQAQHYMAVYDAKRCVLAALVGAGEDLKIYDLERDDGFIDGKLIPGIEAFWDLVERGRAGEDCMPEPDESYSASRALEEWYGEDESGEVASLSLELWTALEGYRAAGEVASVASTQRRKWQNQITKAMAGATYGVLPDGTAVKRVASGRGFRFVISEAKV